MVILGVMIPLPRSELRDDLYMNADTTSYSLISYSGMPLPTFFNNKRKHLSSGREKIHTRPHLENSRRR